MNFLEQNRKAAILPFLVFKESRRFVISFSRASHLFKRDIALVQKLFNFLEEVRCCYFAISHHPSRDRYQHTNTCFKVVPPPNEECLLRPCSHQSLRRYCTNFWSLPTVQALCTSTWFSCLRLHFHGSGSKVIRITSVVDHPSVYTVADHNMYTHCQHV